MSTINNVKCSITMSMCSFRNVPQIMSLVYLVYKVVIVCSISLVKHSDQDCAWMKPIYG